MTGVGLPERARSFPGEERASPLRQVPVPPAYRNASVDQGRSLWSFQVGRSSFSVTSPQYLPVRGGVKPPLDGVHKNWTFNL